MLISEHYRRLNRRLHESPVPYGRRGHRHLPTVKKLKYEYDCKTVLDYGCGKAGLSMAANFTVLNYDPCIPQFEQEPAACDLVICTDVMEHIEPELLENVMNHLRSVVLKAGYFVIALQADPSKTLPDGTNPHKIIEEAGWWEETFRKWFIIESSRVQQDRSYRELCLVVRPA